MHGSSGKLKRVLNPLLNLYEYTLESPAQPRKQNINRACVADVLPWSMISTFRPKVKRGQQQVRQPS